MTIEVRWVENGKIKKKKFASIREALIFRNELKKQGKEVK